MATPAHCAYCFESLSASLEKRQPLSLAQVEELWSKYTSSTVAATRGGHIGEEEEEEEEDPALEDDEDDDDDLDQEDEDMTDVMEPPTNRSAASSALKPPPAISRLVGRASNSPASASASVSTNTSSSSIPSTSTSSSCASAASSRSSAPTAASSRSSIFSALRRTTAGSSSSSSRADEQQQQRAASSAATVSPTEAHPLFVTWNTVSSRGGGRKSLRGCIGTFEAQELSDGLRSYALTSAFDDSRFPPITSRELPSLSCSVTLLTNFEPAASPLSWELGRHGLRISFTYHGRRYGATYLPDVAKEQGWTKEETVVSLMRKAGWSGRRDEWRGVALSVVTYEGSKSSLGWEEWRAWREWCEGVGAVHGRREMN